MGSRFGQQRAFLIVFGDVAQAIAGVLLNQQREVALGRWPTTPLVQLWHRSEKLLCLAAVQQRRQTLGLTAIGVRRNDQDEAQRHEREQ